MSLPKIKEKLYNTKVFSTGQKVEYRPFTVGEQKEIMLSDTLGGENANVYKGLIFLLKKCVRGIDIDKLSIPDFEKLFYDVRSVSEGNTLNFSVKCDECGHENEFQVDTKADFEIKNKENFQIEIEVKESSEPLKIEFSQPSISETTKAESQTYNKEEEKAFYLIAKCLEKVKTNEGVKVKDKDFTTEEALEFLEQLPGSYLETINKFYEDSPSIVTNKDFVCENKECNAMVKEKGSVVRDFLG